MSQRQLVDQMTAVAAYAEVRAVMLAWASVLDWDPVVQARAALAQVLDATPAHPDHLLVFAAQDQLRQDSNARLGPVFPGVRSWPWDAPCGAGQIGSLAGLEAVFDHAGRVAALHRDGDPRMLSVALELAAHVERLRGTRARS